MDFLEKSIRLQHFEEAEIIQKQMESEMRKRYNNPKMIKLQQHKFYLDWANRFINFSKTSFYFYFQKPSKFYQDFGSLNYVLKDTSCILSIKNTPKRPNNNQQNSKMNNKMNNKS